LGALGGRDKGKDNGKRDGARGKKPPPKGAVSDLLDFLLGG
jgi:hypothetical protein